MSYKYKYEKYKYKYEKYKSKYLNLKNIPDGDILSSETNSDPAPNQIVKNPKTIREIIQPELSAADTHFIALDSVTILDSTPDEFYKKRHNDSVNEPFKLADLGYDELVAIVATITDDGLVIRVEYSEVMDKQSDGDDEIPISKVVAYKELYPNPSGKIMVKDQ